MIITDPTWENICQAQADDNSTCHNETSHVSPLQFFDDVGDFNITDIKQQTQFTINRAFKKGYYN